MSTADHTLHVLQRVVYSGWPDTINNLPKDICPYRSYRDEIGLSEGVMFKGKYVIIPDAMRSDILHQLHEAHRARDRPAPRQRNTCGATGRETMMYVWRGHMRSRSNYDELRTFRGETEHRRHSEHGGSSCSVDEHRCRNDMMMMTS